MRPNKRSQAAQLTVRVAAGAAVIALSACLEPGELEDKAQFIGILSDGSVLGDASVGGSGGGGSGSSGNGGSGGATSGNGGSGGVDPCDAVVTKLMTSCVATVCHGSDSMNTLKLEGSGLPASLVGAKSSSTCKELPYIDPVMPEKSLLLTKMTSKPPCGSPMPLGGMLPTDAQRACVLAWIKEGIDGPAMPPGTDGGMTNPDEMCTRGDTDKDGTNDCDDKCINDAEKTMPGMCGCGMPDEDSDDDGALDCEDDCPMDPAIMMGECMMAGMMPGLRMGELAGGFNTAAANPGTMVDPLGPVRSEKVDDPTMTTIVYTGQIHITSSGVASFYENYDDSVRLTVDGMMLLMNGTWNQPTAATIMRPEGWYDFELRLGNGAEASGPPPDMGIGFGYSPMNENNSTDPANYMLPRNMNATTGNLFVTDEP